jgi:acyl transferase domain-containing protein/SAM-dependent methyltransferase
VRSNPGWVILREVQESLGKSCSQNLQCSSNSRCRVIKGTLILESGIIPPNVNFEKVNPKIPLKKWNLQFPVKPVPWPTPDIRRISINSFGVGGTNAHVILDDAYSFLSSLQIDAAHNTRENVPSQDEIDELVRNLNASVSDDSTGTEESVAMSSAGPPPTVNGATHAKSETNGLTNGIHTDKNTSAIPRLITLTAFDEAGVQRVATAQAEYLQTIERSNELNEQDFVDHFAYTISKRSQFPWKSFALAGSLSEAIRSLQALPKPIRARNVPRIGFIFTGQGAQWYAMGRELLSYPVFERSIADASSYMQSIGSPWRLWDELLRNKSDTKVNEPHLAHPACAALQIALVELLRSWRIMPSRVVGHSSGEIAAAYCAGKLTRESAWKVAYYRGFISNQQLSAKGSMMAVGLSEQELHPYLDKINSEHQGELIVACFNSPRNLTVSGDQHKVDALKELLDDAAVFARRLQVKNAYHSAHMQEVSDEYFSLLGSLSGYHTEASDPVHMFSSVTGNRIEDRQLDAQYWVDNLVSPVRFADAVTQMCFSRVEKGQASIQMNANTGSVFSDILVEIGPHAALQSAVKEILVKTAFAGAITSLAVLNRSAPGLSTILNTIGSLYARGYPIDATNINQSPSRKNMKALSLQRPRLLVNLPGYTFNHSEKLIYESRLSKNYRLRKQPRHDLFGAPVPDWNVDAPRWRNILRLSEQPWLRDHVVTNQVVLPGVGYLIAAIEASRQIADPERRLLAFRLRDIALKRALIVPDNKDGVETMLTLTRMDESSLQASKVWRKFTMSSYNPLGEDWIEHCTGYITIDYEAPQNPIDDGFEAREEARHWDDQLSDVKAKCIVPIEINDVYDNLVTTGLEFGPLFKNLSEVKGTVSRSGEMCGIVTVPNVAAAMPMQAIHPHLIHPSTMDSFMHFFLASVMDATGKKTLDRPMVPTFIRDVWVSAELDSAPGHQFCGYGKSTLLAYDKYESDIQVWDVATNEARVAIEGVRATPLDAMDNGSGSTRKLNHELKWTPYLELLDESALSNVQLTSSEDNEDYRGWITKFQIATHLLVNDALDELGGQASEGLDGHLLRYFEWMKYASRALEIDEVSGMRLADFERYHKDPELKKLLLEDVEQHNADGALALRMGKSIVKVLRKEVDPLHLMFGMDDILDRVYAQVAHLGNLPALQSTLLRVIADNSTNLRVLEVGAGTGGSTVGMLEGLISASEDGVFSSSVSTYTFTDISSAFFEKAKEKFKKYRDIMEYKVLDIEKEPDEAGFELGSYDIVIAQNVVHATTNLKRTLTHIRSLLKHDGRLLLQEGVRQDLSWSTIAFGQLPGWWAGTEPTRRMSPWITSEQWSEVIKASGYAGVDLELPDRPSAELHTQSLFVARALPETRHDENVSHEIALVTSTNRGESESELCKELKHCLQQKLKLPQVSVIHIHDLSHQKLDKTVCISVCELERPLLSTQTKTEFEVIKKLLCTCKGVLWVTGDTTRNPELGMVTGLMRTIRWERDIDEANLLTLAVAEPTPSDNSLAERIATLYKQQFLEPLPLEKYQGEFLLQAGSFFTSRLVEAKPADAYLSSRFSRAKPVMTPFKDAGRPIKLATSAPGLLDKLEWVTDDIYDQPLAPTHVEIDIKAVAMNFRDLMIAIGEHMAYSMGNEAAGMSFLDYFYNSATNSFRNCISYWGGRERA